jgi:hypothetical protein
VASNARAAAIAVPALQGRKITPHTFGHTTALHLIDAGNDIFVLKDWLGHAHIKTSSQYVEISVERKRKALEKVPPPGASSPGPSTTRRSRPRPSSHGSARPPSDGAASSRSAPGVWAQVRFRS